MASYITTGKRSIIEAAFNSDVQRWAKAAGIQAPTVKIHAGRHGSAYNPGRQRIGVDLGATRDALVHEFAHHINHITYNGRGHGVTFRIALVEAATIAYGSAHGYTWEREYSNIKR